MSTQREREFEIRGSSNKSELEIRRSSSEEECKGKAITRHGKESPRLQTRQKRGKSRHIHGSNTAKNAANHGTYTEEKRGTSRPILGTTWH